MFDNPVDQSLPSVIERFGSCVHGLIHYYTDRQKVGEFIPAVMKDIKIVTNGGKVFYPFAENNTAYNIYAGDNPGRKSFLFQHPLASMELEDENGIDWSGYAVQHLSVPVWFRGIPMVYSDLLPFSPDDNSVAILASKQRCQRAVLKWPTGEIVEDDGVVTKTGIDSGNGDIYSANGRYRTYVLTLPWYASKNTDNQILVIAYSGSWPNVFAHSYTVPGVNYRKLERLTDGVVRNLFVDSRNPVANACIRPEPSLEFKTREEITYSEFVPDHFTQEEINTTLITADIDNSGNLSHLKLTHTETSSRDRSINLSGSISVATGDATDCATTSQPAGWVWYDGTKQSYTSTSSIIEESSFEVKLHGYGGLSIYRREVSYSDYTSTYVSNGEGTLAESINETSAESSSTITFTLDGVDIPHGIANPSIDTAYTSTRISGLPFSVVSVSNTYEYLFISSEGDGVYSGSDIAVLRVFMYRYSGDMYSLAYGLARGYMTPRTDGGYHFNMASQTLKIGSVFAHGRFHDGYYSTDDLSAKLFGASNPKTGEIVRDMPYPVIYI